MTLQISSRTHGISGPAPERECLQPSRPHLNAASESANFTGQTDGTLRTATASALGAAASLGAPRTAREAPFSGADGGRFTPAWSARPVLPLPHQLLQIAARYAPQGFHRLCKAPGFHSALLREHPDRAWIAAGLARAVDGLAAEPFNREARGMVQVFKKIDVALRLESGRKQILTHADSNADHDTDPNCHAGRSRANALRAHYLRFAGDLDTILIAHEMAALDQISWPSPLDRSIAIIDLCRAGIGALSGEPLKRAQQTVNALKPEDRAQLPEDVAQFTEILQRFGGVGVQDLAEMNPRRSD